jgi:GT2 family glycosyltransferase
MIPNKKSISVILPNYNGKHLLEAYLPSLINALEFSKIENEIIFIDDCSKDDSIEFIKNNYPTLKIIKNKVNVGFSKTCNNGIKSATKDLIFLLNTDVKLEEDYFEKQFVYFDKPDTFGVMGRIMNFDGEKIEDAARLPRFKGSKFKANTFFYTNENPEFTYTTYLSGANALINREKLMQINGFDEIYSPFYFEDFDLGLRAWKMNWKLYYEHESICYHRVSASTSTIKKSNFVKIIYNKNSFTLQSIHLQGTKRKLWHIQLFTTTLMGHIFKGEFWILKSISEYLKNLKNIENSRLKIKNLQDNFSSTIELENIVSIIKESIKNKSINWL